MSRIFQLLFLAASIVVIIFVTSVIAPASAQDNKKIVVFNEGIVNENAKAALIQRFGGVVTKTLPLVNGMAVVLPPQAEKSLASTFEIKRIDNDDTVYALPAMNSKPGGGTQPPAQPQQQLPWGINRIDAEYAHTAGYRGAGVSVAVIDTGIDLDHPDLAANIKGGYNAISSRKTPDDDNGHGTHVAGIIAALDNNIGVVGVAPQASLYSVKVLSRSGTGLTSDVIEGINWCILNNIDIINMSLGSTAANASMKEACDAAAAAGIFVVCAAGNDNGPVNYPAAYDSTIAVAATDINNNRASFSSFGPQVDIAAPGVSILSTYKGGIYATLSGTSMATPHVAGTLALNLSATIYLTADDILPLGTDEYTGFGLVDAGESATGILNYGDN